MAERGDSLEQAVLGGCGRHQSLPRASLVLLYKRMSKFDGPGRGSSTSKGSVCLLLMCRDLHMCHVRIIPSSHASKPALYNNVQRGSERVCATGSSWNYSPPDAVPSQARPLISVAGPCARRGLRAPTARAAKSDVYIHTYVRSDCLVMLAGSWLSASMAMTASRGRCRPSLPRNV